MKYTATIQDVRKHDDEITIDIEYNDGVISFIKSYPWVHMVDINANFEQTIKKELKRINDLEAGYTTIKNRIGEEIQQGGPGGFPEPFQQQCNAGHELSA